MILQKKVYMKQLYHLHGWFLQGGRVFPAKYRLFGYTNFIICSFNAAGLIYGSCVLLNRATVIYMKIIDKPG